MTAKMKRREFITLIGGAGSNPTSPGEDLGDGVFAALPRVLRTGPERARAPDDPGLDGGGEGGERPGLDRGEKLDVPAAL